MNLPTGRLGGPLIAFIYAAILGLSLLGALKPIDNALRDLRFAAAPRATIGDVVFVEIDSRSLDQIGVWPWPRHLHAELLNALMGLGAGDVVFDVDFSVPSSEAEDTAFAKALDDAGGYAYLAAFQQQRTGSGELDYNLPLDRFRKFADPVSVNVSVGADGVVRSYPLAMSIGETTVPSVASVFDHITGAAGSSFNIDFSIDPAGIDRISAVDLLQHKIDAVRVAGKHVIIGASAVELRDFFVVPRYGAIPGALLQALAADSLKQGRALLPVWPIPGLVLVGLLGLVAIGARRRIPLTTALLGALMISSGAEALALLLQTQWALLLDTSAIHAATVSFTLTVLGAELIRRGEQRLRATRERDAVRRMLDRVITDNFDGVVIIDAQSRIVAASQFAETLLGRKLQDVPAADVLPPRFMELLASALAGRQQHGELTLHLGEADRVLDYVVTHSEVQLGATPSAVACLTFRDITERRQAEDRLVYLGHHDPLTGALSRTRLVEMIEAAIADKRDVAMVLVDLRRFRIINDTLGHTQGDLLLKQVVSRLKSMGPDAVARLGGDSFALLLPGMTAEKLAGFCATVAQWLGFPYQLADGHQATIAASAGATTTQLSGYDADVLLSHADMALSAAKLRSGSGTALFTPEMDDRLKDRQAMDAALREALVRHEFSIAYQPQIDMTTGALVGAEALARWAHPILGPISPTRFVPAAEETGLIVELGRWALNTACAEAVRWPAHLKISVNVSPVQFQLSDILADVRGALAKTGLPAERLELEITEGIFVHDFEAVALRLEELRQLGVSVALDDFGTGYSSLSYLGRLPIDKIKIDQSFVKRLPADTEAAAIINAVVTLAQSLGKTTIAEGIETADQAWMLQMIGCRLAQGFHFGRPMTARDIWQRISDEMTAKEAMSA